MSEVRSILERGVEGFEPSPDARERTLRRVVRRRRRRRLGAATGAVAVTLALVVGLWSAFRPGPRVDHPVAPKTGLIGGQRPVAVGYGSVWAISCVQRCGNDQRNASGRLLRIDPSTGRAMASVPLGYGPQAVAAGEGGVWVLDFWRGRVTHVDPDTNGVVATIPLRLPFPVCSCPGAHDFAPFDLTTGAGAVWVITDRGAVARIDPATNRVAAYIRIPGENGGGIAVAGNRVWISNGVLGVWAIDPASNSVVLKGHFVHGSHRVEAGSLIAADGEVWASGANVRRTGDPANPWAFAKGGGAARIDPATGHLLTTFDFDHPATITAAGEGAVWAAAGTDRVYRIDTRTYAVTGPFSFGGTLWAVIDGTGWVVTAHGSIERIPLP